MLLPTLKNPNIISKASYCSLKELWYSYCFWNVPFQIKCLFWVLYPIHWVIHCWISIEKALVGIQGSSEFCPRMARCMKEGQIGGGRGDEDCLLQNASRGTGGAHSYYIHTFTFRCNKAGRTKTRSAHCSPNPTVPRWTSPQARLHLVLCHLLLPLLF